jgi:hypothetical protein
MRRREARHTWRGCARGEMQKLPAVGEFHGALPEAVFAAPAYQCVSPIARGFTPSRDAYFGGAVMSAAGTDSQLLHRTKIRHYRGHCGHAAGPAGARVRELMTHSRRSAVTAVV